MNGRVTTIIQFKKTVRMVNFNIDGVKAKTYVDDKNSNSIKWAGIKCDDYIKGLEWFDKEGKIIDADSQITIER